MPRRRRRFPITADTVCILVPYFEVQSGQLDAFKAMAAEFVARAQGEPGCMHHAFAFEGHFACCRQGFENAQALLHHCGDDGELFKRALAISRLLRVEVHAPAAQLEQLRGPLAPMNTRYFVRARGGRQ